MEIDIYTKRYCPYCIAAKRLLTYKGVTFTEIDVRNDQIAPPRGICRLVMSCSRRNSRSRPTSKPPSP